MIDLPHAADDLRAAVTHHQPDLDRVRGRVRRRQHRRRALGAAAAVVVLAVGAASAMAIVGEDRDHGEDVVTEPGPTTPDPAPDPEGPAAPEPERGGVAAADWQLVDHGNLRLTVPAGWEVEDPSTSPDCGGPGAIVIVDYPRLGRCERAPAIEITAGEWSMRAIAIDTSQFHNGIPTAPVTSQLGGQRWAFTTLDATVELSNELDVGVAGSILSSIAPSARHTAMADLESEGLPLWASPRVTWQTVAHEGVAIQVPPGWSIEDQTWDLPRRGPGCLSWTTGDSVVVLGGGGSCDRGIASGRPIDGAWLRPLAGTDAEGRSAVALERRIDGATVRVYPGTDNVLEVAIDPGGGREALLLRVGLGRDGHIASSIVASIRVLDPSALVLPCGPVVVLDRSTLDLPEDLDVAPVVGVGGWPEEQGTDRCTFHLTSRDDPARHLTFGLEDLAFAPADGADDRPRDAFVEELGDGRGLPRWGSTFGGGYGAQFRAVDGERTLRIVASGITEAEAEALFTSLRYS